ncbi:GNAT family N-acetyltransferase [Christiangramia sabulilitoris]|uniref:GNAT family N-acetyltransferase n=1 Tax=Christiangramia sabulilitoris TaxID=2583991 RepID=A0A550HXB9_9FLAO|nr:GNAT family N-acetyltransferase [Christiangramia sabulilitoris]TRO63315.1 GNAT family N-acetyltransferase [Christiangramia sabulilitoris]
MKSTVIPELKTERLILNRIEKTDHTNIYHGLSHPEVIKYYGVSYTSLEAVQEQMDWYDNLEKSGSGMWWAIREKTGLNFMGAIGINDYQKEHKKAELGFWLLPEYWKKGYVRESSQAIINYLFQKGLHRLEAYVEAENSNSSKALVKLGFSHEGRMIDAEIKNDTYISVDIFAKINPDN